ncbi:unnamed protein product [Prorocentrum cordatum]|uniref:Serine aminopeptidase S33 domain-containing protein n=1 Tax=Prorocentrum cordatum TaxID=2364126 RepID=A0ABN9W5L8_9DINO|nr:unnamed protein product [Polarella glacialis]
MSASPQWVRIDPADVAGAPLGVEGCYRAPGAATASSASAGSGGAGSASSSGTSRCDSGGAASPSAPLPREWCETLAACAAAPRAPRAASATRCEALVADGASPRAPRAASATRPSGPAAGAAPCRAPASPCSSSECETEDGPDEVWDLIIKPPRMRYSNLELVGRYPESFKVGRWPVRRTDFQLVNDRSMTLECTIFQPRAGLDSSVQSPPGQERACVVFCHGHGSNRLNGFQLVPILLPLNISLVCFDFAGSGMSGGEFTSLGYYERDDLRCVIQHLREQRGFTRIGVWGVSMGASTALMHAARDPMIAGVVADSPFSDLGTLIRELCAKWVPLPWALLCGVLCVVRGRVQKKARFDIYDVAPHEHMASCHVPVYFLHGDKDDFISPKHSEELRRCCGGDADLLKVHEGTHTSPRPLSTMARAALFLVRAMRWEDQLPDGVTDKDVVTLANRAGAPLQAPRRGQNARGDRSIQALLESAAPANVSLGIVKVACRLAALYAGAEVVSCTPGLTAAAEPLRARLPASVSGTLRLRSEHTEFALCWVEGGLPRPGHGGEARVRVWFALASTAALSLTSVLLRFGSASPAGSVPLAGFACEAIDTADQTLTRALQAGQRSSLSLTLGSDGSAEVEAGGARATNAAWRASAAAVEAGAAEDACVWALQWRRAGEANGARVQLRAATIAPALGC